MTNGVERRLLQREEALHLLQIPDSDLQQLIDTKQIIEIFIRGHRRFDSLDIYQLIEAYKQTQSRRKN
jgi:hypothetical protein